MPFIDNNLPLLNISHNSISFGDRFTSVERFSADRILLKRFILAFVSGRWHWCPGRCTFFLLADGAESSVSSATLAEELASPVLDGVVTVEVLVQLLGTFLFLPSKVVSMSLTERREKDKQSHFSGLNGVANMTRNSVYTKNFSQNAIFTGKNLGIERLESPWKDFNMRLKSLFFPAVTFYLASTS